MGSTWESECHLQHLSASLKWSIPEGGTHFQIWKYDENDNNDTTEWRVILRTKEVTQIVNIHKRKDEAEKIVVDTVNDHVKKDETDKIIIAAVIT